MKRTTQTDLWTYPDASTLGTDVGRGVDLTGFSVEATDGGLGKIEEVTYDTSQSYIVVDTGPWIFSARRRPQRHTASNGCAVAVACAGVLAEVSSPPADWPAVN